MLSRAPGRPTPLALALLALASLSSTAVQAQEAAPAQPAAQAGAPLPQVVVTGSRLGRLQQEGATPVTVIKAEDIDRLGYRNVSDALAALTENSGFTQGEDFGNTFTPAANAISLRGLGPNHTLVLVNGRRLTEYPTAYEGSVNFVNLANIPSALVDRIEVLSGGASAIYGSDAVAGVVNIVLKRELDGLQLNLRAGTTQRGGGTNARAQLSGGFQSGALRAAAAVELSGRDPIWSRQRPFMADTTLKGGAPTVVFGRRDVQSRRYVTPADCAPVQGLFEGSVGLYTGSSGSYCGSGRVSPTYWTTQTGNRSAQLAGVLTYTLSDRHELFADLQTGWTDTENNTRGPAWTSESANQGYFRNTASNRLETWSRRISPEEMGGADRFNRHWTDRTHQVALGARGDLFGSWSYEAALSSGYYQNRTRTPRFLAGVDEFFLGPRQGQDAQGVWRYTPDEKRLYRPLSAQEFDRIVGESWGRNTSWTHTLSASANGELLALPAGPLRAAVVAEAGKQGFSNLSDPRLGQGVFYATSEAAEVRGTRDRKALGLELQLPLLRTLSANLAARHDSYRFAGRDDASTTYNAGLEFRPLPELLLRAHHATSFRAPDMNYIFAERTRGYYSGSTDYYRCAKAGLPLDKCEFANVSPGFNFVRSGSKDLRSEHGKSWGLGLVWQPTQQLDLSLDFWKVAISDLVTNLSGDQVLRDESACRTGLYDISSPSCQATLARVVRNPEDALLRPGEVSEIRVNPINAARKSTWGWDLSLRYGWSTASLGRFQASAKYSKVRSYVYQAFDGDAAINRVGTFDYGDWPSRLNTSLNWTLGDIGATLSAQRNGKVARDDQAGWLGPYWNLNLDTRYQLSARSTLSLTVNNLLNKVRRDESAAWPYYPVGYYLPYGRQFWVGFEHRFKG
ncbi:TonB-dependent receptor [Pelomonas sp. CA6]|uniref:TonB-dependent receptor domain-containing protein n=1 Tax=Pelomonas sp. CA6 TaxID=2907999 RepID=UPI001F4BAB66|nr:TonB-dependent receptor [Pelomonas sp. CA6]MCH7342909.1 TonB-dependent receptor [Pelomonas sp. CA6]